MRRAIVLWGVAVMAAAYWTGARHGFTITTMTGFLPPHYGYSAYAVVPLLFLARWRGFRWLAAAALLLGGNRAAWVGSIAGWAWAGGARRRALAVILAALAAVGGLALKPRHDNDAIRAHIWKAALATAIKHPDGVGIGGFCIGVDGNEVSKAHSDVLQLLVEQGVAKTLFVLVVLLRAFEVLIFDGAPTPAKAVVVALTAQSIIDNRLHHHACAALYVAAWLLVLLERRDLRFGRSRPSANG